MQSFTGPGPGPGGALSTTMGNATKYDARATDIVNARKLPIHLEWSEDEEGERVLRGWVSCELRGPIDLERCSMCSFSRGALLEATAGPPEILCAWSPSPGDRPPTDSARH